MREKTEKGKIKFLKKHECILRQVRFEEYLKEMKSLEIYFLKYFVYMSS